MIRDNRLPLHTEIIGISLAGEDKAYPLAVIRKQGLIHDQVGGQHIAIVYAADGDYVNAFYCHLGGQVIKLHIDSGALASRSGALRWTWAGQPLSANTPQLQKLQIQRQWWLGWMEFHPASEVYQNVPEQV